MMPSTRPIKLLFDNAARPGGVAIQFENPIAEIRADSAAEVDAALLQMDLAVAQGRYVAGYLAYELGYALEPRLRSLMPQDHGPLVRIFVFDGPQYSRSEIAAPVVSPLVRVHERPHQWQCYEAAFNKAAAWILDGDIYQVNLTFPLDVETESDPAALYAALRGGARAGASALLRMGDEDILSFSPETFFTLRNRRMSTRPMKGTAARGLTPELDLAARRALRQDPKERAENLMIVDLLRNDLSRIAKPGSVRVSDLYTVETFPRLHTMTSGVEADLRDDIVLSDIFRAVFPCGSITGAPKIRAMEIIRELEPEPRNVYCGAIGFAGPGVAAFSVAIRTLSIHGSKGIINVGSGIVADSIAEREYAECLLKAQFLTRHEPEVALIETLLWERAKGFALAEAHDERLAASAAYFGFPHDPLAAQAVLDAAVARYGSDRARVRLLLQSDGKLNATATSLPAAASQPEWVFEIAPERINSRDRYYHHKTTRRALYDDAFLAANARGIDEVVFLNEHGDVAEGSRSTVFVQRGDTLLTPPLSAGALNGCLRRAAIDRGFAMIEARLTIADLETAQAIWFGNALRGFVRGRRAV